MIMSAEEFLKQATEGARVPEQPFQPRVSYSKDGDCIEFLAVSDSFYGERLDDLVTVFYSQRTGQIIGSLIKGVTNHFKKCPNLMVSIEDHKIRIDHLLLSKALASGKTLEEVTVRKYQLLLNVAVESKAVAEVPDLGTQLCEARS